MSQRRLTASLDLHHQELCDCCQNILKNTNIEVDVVRRVCNRDRRACHQPASHTPRVAMYKRMNALSSGTSASRYSLAFGGGFGAKT